MKLIGLKIIRPLNCAFAFLLVLFAYNLNIGYFTVNFSVLLAAISTFLIVGGGNTFNDFFDYKIDLKNKPYRPIPRKLIKRSEALILSALLFLSGIIASSFVNSHVFMIAIVATLALIAYGAKGHYLGFSGDLLIAFLTSFVFIMGSFVASSIVPFNIILIAGAAFAINVSREVIKDVEDYEADKGIKLTLPQKIGNKGASLVAVAFLIFNLIIAYILLPIYVTRIFFLLSLPLTIFILSRIIKIIKMQDVKTARKTQELMKLIMFIEFVFVALDKFAINISL